MTIVVNGQVQDVAEGSSLADVVRAAGLELERVAVEHERVVVPRAQLESTLVSDGDKVEIVCFVGGG